MIWVGYLSPDHHNRRKGNSEMEQLLRAVRPSQNRETKMQKNIFFTNLLAKCSLMLLFLIFYKLKTIKIFNFEHVSTKCLYDTVQESFKPANMYLSTHPIFRRVVVILSSLLIDIVFLYILIYFAIKAKTARIIYAVALFYGIRAICQNLFLFQFPSNWIFSDPGFFSLVVPYGKTSDFYFSGHSGFLMMSTIELIHMKQIWVAFINFVSMLYTGWMLTATQAHYSIGSGV